METSVACGIGTACSQGLFPIIYSDKLQDFNHLIAEKFATFVVILDFRVKILCLYQMP
jgi:hypothetical protein